MALAARTDVDEDVGAIPVAGNNKLSTQTGNAVGNGNRGKVNATSGFFDPLSFEAEAPVDDEPNG